MLQLILGLIVALVVVGVLLWAINKLLGPYMQASILQMLNVAVVIIVAICVIFWILNAFGLLPLTAGPPVPRLR
jgi:hypothetical protein